MNTCKYCGKTILWQNKKPYDATIRDDDQPPVIGSLHFLTCPTKIRAKEQRICPVCLINSLEVTEQKLEVDLTKDICRVHAPNWDYNKLRKLRNKVKTHKVDMERKELYMGGLDMWSE